MKITASNRGFAEVAVLYFVIAGIALLFIPNPVSNAVGVGVRPNKSIQTDATTQVLIPATADGETLYHKDGSVAMISQTVYKRKDLDQQQHVSLWDSLLALPRLFLLLVILGAAGVPGFGFMTALWKKWKNQYFEHRAETKKIILGLDQAFATIPLTLAAEKLPGEVDRAALAEKIQKAMLIKLSANYDQSTKDLVRALRG